MKNCMEKIFASHLQTIELVAEQLSDSIAESVEVIVNALLAGNKLLVMGNGGSAAEAQHFVAELVGRFKLERRPFPAISLVDNVATLTAVGNDFGFEMIFQRQVEALANQGDIVLGISTSGNSENILFALQAANKLGCITFGLLGQDGGKIAVEVGYPLVVSGQSTPRIQEAHLTIIHILCELIEKQLFHEGVVN